MRSGLPAQSAPLLVRRRADPGSRHDDELVLTYELRQKSRLRTVLASGREVGLFLERGAPLRGGDRLQADTGEIIRVVAAAEELMEARCADPLAFARCAYHLGNRHTPVEIRSGASGGILRFAADSVLETMLVGLGIRVRRVRGPFDPEPGAYGAAHHQHAGDQRHSGIIHDHFGRGQR